MGKFIDISGKQFYRLTVISFARLDKHKNAMWLVRCVCGNSKTVVSASLRNGNTRSCGCLQKEKATGPTKHNMSKSPEFQNWAKLKYRCLTSSNKDFKDYGGRGITVCEEWQKSFEQFYKDMGPRPSPNHSIDRIDNDKGYSKENCRWATKSEQCINRKKFKNSKSQYKGIRFRINRKTGIILFEAYISCKNRRYFLGTFQTEKEAAKAYNKKALELHGKLANINKV